MSSRTPSEEPLRTFDWTVANDPARAVVIAVAEAADEDPLEIDPLYAAVDTDALDELLAPRDPGRDPMDGSIEFEYHGYDVVLTGRGRGYVFEEDVNLQGAPVRTAEGIDE